MAGSAEQQERTYKRLAWGTVAAGFVFAMVYGYTISGGHPVRAALAVIFLAAAPLALGGIAGFLFGIPKTLQNGDNQNGDKSEPKHRWQANTNLEQVSDWLTKILIGVGLTQLGAIPDRVQETGDYIAESLGPDASGATVSAIIVTFAITGFVIAYLLTKFDLGLAIDRQDGILDQLEGVIIKNPGDRDAVESYMLSSLYLGPPSGFERAIQSGLSFLRQEGHPQPEDGNVFGYLACAYGQMFALRRAARAPEAELQTLRDAVVNNAREAIARIPEWKVRLRQYANPPVGSMDDDLAALKDYGPLQELLGIA